VFYSEEQGKRNLKAQEIMRSGKATNANLCQYKNVSCVRCCLPHIGGDLCLEDSEENRTAPLKRNRVAYHLKYSNRYPGPGGIVMKFKNFNLLKDPRIEASQYEDSFPDVGREEMERRFSGRRELFLDIYDRKQPERSLPTYMEAAQRNEGYKYKPVANTGLVSLFLGGSVPKKRLHQGELPECQLLGFIDGKRRAGCMAHPLAETSHGYDGRDLVGFFHHTGGCKSVNCEASQEFRFLDKPARKIFDKAVEGMSWYEYSRHATSVLIYYLRSYDHILQKLEEKELLDTLTLERLVEFTNSLYDEWPMRKSDYDLHSMDSLDILSTDIPLAERMMYIVLDTRFLQGHFATQLQQARDHVEMRIEAFRNELRMIP
jgi:hypothetical protein